LTDLFLGFSAKRTAQVIFFIVKFEHYAHPYSSDNLTRFPAFYQLIRTLTPNRTAKDPICRTSVHYAEIQTIISAEYMIFLSMKNKARCSVPCYLNLLIR